MPLPKHCLRCGRSTAAGSYCKPCRNKRSPSRVRGRRGQRQREQMLQAFAYKCADCGAYGVPLEVHHVDHDHRNNATTNLVPLCKRCHARAGRR